MIFSVPSSSFFAIITIAACIVTVPSTVVAHPACKLGQRGCRHGMQRPPVRKGSDSQMDTKNFTLSSKFVVDIHAAVHQGESSQAQLADNSSTTGDLKHHLKIIQDYLENPIQHLKQMDETKDKDSESIVDILENLEEQFIDSSKAQEFHTLGGWSLLASLVSNSVHSSNIGGKNDNDDDLFIDQILTIRTHAAGAMGTAVNAVEEFRSWVMEPMSLDTTTSTSAPAASTTTTALELVVHALLEVSDATVTPGSCNKVTLEYQEDLASETVYALESFLIGNPQAQIAFSKMSSNPALVLGRQAKKLAQEASDAAASTSSSNARMSRHAIRMTTRLLSLVTAMAHSSNTIIVESFSTDDWCEAAMMASTLTPSSTFKRLVFKSLHATAITAMVTLGPHCSLKLSASSALATAEKE